MTHRIRALAFVLTGLQVGLVCAQPASQPAQDAWPLYSRAIDRIQQGHQADIMSPAASTLEYPDYPPYPPEWQKRERAAYQFDAPARALAREARSMHSAHWPAGKLPDGKVDLRYLNGCRALANEIGDAALWEHLHGDDAAAVESIRDLVHLADLVEGKQPSFMVEPLVAVGIRALAMNRLEIISANCSLSANPAEPKALQVSTAKALIRELFVTTDPAPRYRELLRREAAAGPLDNVQQDRFLTVMRRSQMENNLACMSLACHLFRFDNHRWPASVQELTRYLPAEPRDAWGDMGYVLLKTDRPHNPDRPLVYSRCNSKDGLFYRDDEPQYSFSPGFGTGPHRKEGGQFRDVTLWSPTHPNPTPSTRPLN